MGDFETRMNEMRSGVPEMPSTVVSSPENLLTIFRTAAEELERVKMIAPDDEDSVDAICALAFYALETWGKRREAWLASQRN